MNIFYIDENPIRCAEQHCDKHVVKMCVEYAQLLSTAHRVVDGKLWYGVNAKGRKLQRYFHDDPVMNTGLYKACHVNHPSSIWVRQSAQNYNWLYELWIALCDEYTHRYGKVHESQRKLEYLLLLPPMRIPDIEFTQPTPAMKQYPHCIVEGDSLTSYRNFYWEDKFEFAKWTKRDKPDWWIIREGGTPPRKDWWIEDERKG
jgi:hypothetical protein